MKKLTILGAGSWGLTLAWLFATEQKPVFLWGRPSPKMATLSQTRQVSAPLPVTLPESVNITTDLEQALVDSDVVVLAVTSQGTREVAKTIANSPAYSRKTIMVNASKGIEFPGLKAISAVLAEELPESPFAVLSGPTLAAEILKGLPTASSVASKDAAISEYLQVHLTCENRFRLYSNTDVVGVELGGSLKNIFAIASGYMHARQLGDNAMAALITRGLAEMTRFSVSQGADVQTLFGLSGLGDLLATCNSPYSRNYQVGYRLAAGKTLAEILEELGMVAEGVKTTYAVSQLSDKLGIDMPVVRQVESALNGNHSEAGMIKSLMSRKLKAE